MYTKGPWECSRVRDCYDGQWGYRLYRMETDVEASDNARLIAAAPDLLSACRLALQDVRSRIYHLPVNADKTDKAILEAQERTFYAAIARAEGR
jgi:hypothetical protein